MHALQQRRHFTADDVMADADDQPAMLDRKGVDRRLMRGHQMARGRQERIAFDRKPYQPWGSLQQPPAESFFQPFDLQADRRLGAVQRLCGARKTVEIGGQYKGLHRFDIERLHDQSFQIDITEI